MTALRIALVNIRLVMRTKGVLFFTFVFPLVWLFVFEGIFAHGNPKAIMYFFGPVVTLNIMGSAFWGLGLQSVMQRERGILRRYRLAPINSVSIVAANLLANYLLELPTIGLLVFCAKVIFHMPLTFGWGTLLILVTVGTFGFAGFGLTIASIANTMQEAQIYNNLVWVTLLFLSGATIPLPLLPGWIQHLATFLPATYLVTSFQAIMIQAEPLRKHLPEMLALVLSGIFGLLFAWKLFRWEKEERIPRSAQGWALLFVVPFLLIGLWMTVNANPTKAWATTYSMLGRGPSDPQKGSPVDAPLAAIEDFENGGRTSGASNLKFDLPEGSAPTARIRVISPGAAGTGHALRLEGNLSHPFSLDKALVIASCPLSLPRSESGAQSLEFWLRGDLHTYRVRLVPPKASQAGEPEITLVPSAQWQSLRIPMTRAEPAGKSGPPETWKLEVAVAGVAGDFFIDLDQIAVYGVSAKPAPSGEAAAGAKH